MKKIMYFVSLLLVLVLMSGTAVMAEADSAATEEGFVEEGEGYTSVVSWIENNGKQIFGKFYYPADYQEGQTYPVVIMCHGTDATHEIYEKGQWPVKMAQDGIISYVFDFCGGSANSLSDGTMMELSGETMIADVNAIMDHISGLPFYDARQVYLMGQSRGGMIAAMAAGRRADEIAGLILMYPGLGMVDRLREEYPDLSAVEGQETIMDNDHEFGVNFLTDVYDWDVAGTCSQFKGNVLLIHGMNDKTVTYDISVKALNEYYAESASQLVLVAGKKSVHAFDVFYEEGQTIAWNAAHDYMVQQIALNAAE